MTRLQSNFTPRTSRIVGITHVVNFGLQAFLQELTEQWQNYFFDRDVEEVVAAHKKRCEQVFGPGNLVGEDHVRALHALGYLPIEVHALPEGTLVPLRVPMFIIENTHDDFAWLVNYLETDLSANLWLPCTSATIALRFRRMLDDWAELTSDTPEFVDWQGHDFSARGMETLYAAAASGAGHLLSFAGTDSIPSLDWVEYYYGASGFVGGSVPASEHSVMCAGGELTELETFRRLIQLHPTGIISIVSDTWDFWLVLTQHLVTLKEEIMARDGKVVIRPDSGNPADIICGDPNAPVDSPAYKGAIQIFWEVFGGTTNSKGYKVLDSHIGLIYGDSITYDIGNDICERLAAKGFASTTPVFGVGSFTYQYNTRDTLGFAIKATYALVDDVGHDLFKDPVTDSGVKKSGKGRQAVLRDTNGELYAVNSATPEQETVSEFRLVYRNGELLVRETFREIAERVERRYILPD